MAVNDVYKVTVIGALSGQRTLNIFHYIETAAASGQAELGVENAFHLAVMGDWLLAVSGEWGHTATDVQKFRPAPPLLRVTVPHTGSGSILGDSCPPADAVVITLFGTIARRSDRGRKYLAGIAEADHTGGSLTAGAVTRFTALANKLNDNLIGAIPNTGTWAPVIHSRFLNKAPRDVFVPVAFTVLRSIMRTQRRRQVGVGK